MATVAQLRQLNIIVSDMSAALSFYRELGWTIDSATPEHATADMPDGITVEFDSTSFAPVWDSGYAEATGGTTVLGVSTDTRTAVDELYERLIDSGGRGRQPPYDAFWGSRYAIVEDPDGNPVGLMSPRQESAKYWPPHPAPGLR